MNPFDDNNPDPKDAPVVTPPAEQKFTVGDKEYTQDELNDLVGKGSRYTEIETQFNTKLDRVVPDYTRASQEAAELRTKVAALEKAQIDARADTNTLTPEDIRIRARQEAANLGLMTDETAPTMIRAEIAGYELRQETNGVIKELDGMGIKADPKVILRYMDAAELENPQQAAEQLYGSQIKTWQEKQLADQKPEGLYTEGGSNAGAFKLPPDVKVTDENLAALMRQAIGSEE